MATGSERWDVCFVCDGLADQNIYRRGGGTVFPLHLASDEQGFGLGDSRLNFSRNLTKSFTNFKATPQDVFHYAYAVFHNPGYRSRYAEFLKIDFPRLPLTGNLELFRALSRLGGELVALHLLESPALENPRTQFVGPSREVVKAGWVDGTVWIDAGGKKSETRPGTSGFRGVPEAVWNFHIGGYQVCEKCLKDRKGRMLPTTTSPTTTKSSSPSTKPSASCPRSTKSSTNTASGPAHFKQRIRLPNRHLPAWYRMPYAGRCAMKSKECNFRNPLWQRRRSQQPRRNTRTRAKAKSRRDRKRFRS